MKLLDDYPKVFLGINQENKKIYLYPPQWEDWYWSFGRIGNKKLLTYLDSFNLNNLMMDIKEYFKYFILSDKELWIFWELVVSIYHLKATSNFYYFGGSHVTQNSCEELLKNPKQYEHINRFLIPKLIDELYKVLL